MVGWLRVLPTLLIAIVLPQFVGLAWAELATDRPFFVPWANSANNRYFYSAHFCRRPYGWVVGEDGTVLATPGCAELRSGRRKCRNDQSARKTFVEKRAVVPPFARGKRAELANSCGFSAMPPAAGSTKRLLAGLGIPISCSAVLRQLKSHVRKHRETKPLRAIATDDWSWCEGFS
jgi:hypothetical protein